MATVPSTGWSRADFPGRAGLADELHLSFDARGVLNDLVDRVDPETGRWDAITLTDYATEVLRIDRRRLLNALRELASAGVVEFSFPRARRGSITLLQPSLAQELRTISPKDPPSTSYDLAGSSDRSARTPLPLRASLSVVPTLEPEVQATVHDVPGPSRPPKEGRKEDLPSLWEQITARLDTRLVEALESPSNAGARRAIEDHLTGAARNLGDPTGEQIVTKVLERWPAPETIRNPAGFLLDRVRSAEAWAATLPRQQCTQPDTASPATASPARYGLVLAAEVLAGRQDADEARLHCDFAFTTPDDRLAALRALTSALRDQVPAAAGAR